MSITLTTIGLLLIALQLNSQTSIKHRDPPSLCIQLLTNDVKHCLHSKIAKQPQRNNNITLILAIIMSGDIQLNPCPKDSNKLIFPCGICEHPVTWNCAGVACDDCSIWFHKTCIDMCSKDFDILNRSNVNWLCCKCDSLNCNSFTFHSYELECSNYYHPIADMSIDSVSSAFSPLKTSSPGHQNRSANASKASKTKSSSSTSSRGKSIYDLPAKQNLRILTLNCRSILGKRSELSVLLDYIKPDIVCATESWLHGVKPGKPPSPSHVKSSEVFPEGYVAYRNDRSSFGGGVFTLMKDNLVSTEEQSLITNCELEWVKVKLPKNKDLYVGNFYMPHRNLSDMKELDRSLQQLFDTPKPKSTVLVGDFNCPDIDWSTHTVKNDASDKAVQQALIDTTSANLTQIRESPTREHNILDLVFTSNPTLVKSSISVPGLSDHEAIVTDIDIKPVYSQKQRRKIYKYSKANWDQLKQDCTKVASDTVTKANSGATVNDTWETFKNGILNSMDQNIPTRLSSLRTTLPWVNRSIKKMLRRKQRLYKQAKKNNTWQNYRHYQREVKRTIRKAEHNYINNMLEEGLKNHDSKPFWRYIKSKKQDSIGVSPLKDRGQLTSDSLQKADILLRQFQSVFTKEDPTEPLPDIHSVPIKHPLTDITIDVNGVAKLLRNLNTAKACGPDAIPNKILASCADQLSPGLSAIFQLSINTGTLPSDWLQANISSVYKKGDKHQAENYRPISLTCVSCKLLEHIICRHLMKHLEDNNILTDLNHGFRSGYSCESQLLVTMEDLLQGYDSNTQIDCAILDFSKAFDTVPHKKLLHKLSSYGIHGQIHSWLTQFLTARTMQVVLEGQTTRQVTVDSGVPQGTVLGPILFLCHINDLPACVRSQTRLFADDCLLYRQIKSQQDHTILQQDLQNLEKWATSWGMKFNAKKCYILSIRGKSHHFYSLDNTILQQVSSNPYLGITISEDLKWGTHISNTVKKANSTLGFLRRNLRSCPTPCRRTAYISLIRPILEYGSVIWDPYYISDINIIERVQHRAARFISGDYTTRDPGCVTAMLEDSKLPPLQDRRRNIRLSYYYKVVEGLVPAIPPQRYLTPRKPGRTIRAKSYSDFNTTNIIERSACHNSRGFSVPTSRTEQYKHSFFVQTTIDWNHLSDSVVT